MPSPQQTGMVTREREGEFQTADDGGREGDRTHRRRLTFLKLALAYFPTTLQVTTRVRKCAVSKLFGNLEI